MLHLMVRIVIFVPMGMHIRSALGPDEAFTHRAPQHGGATGRCARAAPRVCTRIAPEQTRTGMFAAGAITTRKTQIISAQDRGLGPQEAVSTRQNRCTRDPLRPLAPSPPAGYVSGVLVRRKPHFLVQCAHSTGAQFWVREAAGCELLLV